jgi:hypothetical protein
MSHTLAIRLCIALATLATTTTALAQEPEATPPPAQRAIYSLALERVGGAAYSSFRPTVSDTSYGVTTFTIAGPALNPVALPRVGFDVLLGGGLTIGGALGAGSVTLSQSPDQQQSTSQSGRAVLLSPRVGYRIAAAPWLDITPRGGLTIVAAGYSGPDNRICSFNGMTQTCNTVQGETDSLTAFALSLEALAAAHVTSSFNVLGGLAYDQVVAASGSTSRSDANGNRTSEDAKAGGRYLGVQLWLGLGGYF